MRTAQRLGLLGVLVLALSQCSAAGNCEVVIEHNWCVEGRRGWYGFFQYRTGPGALDVRTAVLLGPRHFDIRAPLYLVLLVCAIPPVVILSAPFVRGILSEDTGPTNKPVQATAD
jgi:hypothetical protein